MSSIEHLFPLGRRRLFNSDCEKAEGRGLETQEHCAFELFAPELIHESRNCSIVHIPTTGSSRRKTHSWSTMSISKLRTSKPPLQSKRPSCRNRFIKKLIRARVVPTISAKVSWLIFGITFSDLPSFRKRASNKRVRPNRFSAESKSWSTKSAWVWLNDQQGRRRTDPKTRAHGEVLLASRPFQFLGQNNP
jgi:hypothetical protein